MYYGVWQGKELDDKRILILGESHYGDTDNGSTAEVVKCYLYESKKADRWQFFFDKIAESFGYTDDKDKFYEKVYFGNYVEELCGVGDNKASTAIKNHVIEYNNHLFEFVNKKRINVIVCFSKLTYFNLPGRTIVSPGSEEKTNIGKVGEKRNYAHKYCYTQGVEYTRCNVKLNKPLIVYAFRHPSGQAGYVSKQVLDYIKKECMKDLGGIVKVQ